MGKLLFLAFMLVNLSFADATTNQWNASSLTKPVIKKIQQLQHQYQKCIANKAQKLSYHKIKIRSESAAIIKQCEKVLSQIHQVYLVSKVHNTIATRHLKKIRIDMTRRLLKQLMFAQVAHRIEK